MTRRSTVIQELIRETGPCMPRGSGLPAAVSDHEGTRLHPSLPNLEIEEAAAGVVDTDSQPAMLA